MPLCWGQFIGSYRPGLRKTLEETQPFIVTSVMPPEGWQRGKCTPAVVLFHFCPSSWKSRASSIDLGRVIFLVWCFCVREMEAWQSGRICPLHVFLASFQSINPSLPPPQLFSFILSVAMVQQEKLGKASFLVGDICTHEVNFRFAILRCFLTTINGNYIIIVYIVEHRIM